MRTPRNTLGPAGVSWLSGLRPAGPPPVPRTGPIIVQRRASNSGIICLASHKVAPRPHPRPRTVTIHVSDIELAIHGDDRTLIVGRTTTTDPVGNIKVQNGHLRSTTSRRRGRRALSSSALVAPIRGRGTGRQTG